MYYVVSDVVYRYDFESGSAKKIARLEGIDSPVMLALSPDGRKAGILAAVKEGNDRLIIRPCVLDLETGSLKVFPLRALYGASVLTGSTTTAYSSFLMTKQADTASTR